MVPDFAGVSTFLLLRHNRRNVLENLSSPKKGYNYFQIIYKLVEILMITIIISEKTNTISISDQKIWYPLFFAKMY